MRKIFKLVLFVLLVIFIPSNYVNATINRVDDIENIPIADGKKIIYINEVNDSEEIIYDSNFVKTKSGLSLNERLTESKTYTNPFKIIYKNAGYYIDDDGNIKLVNVIINYDSLFLYLPVDYSSLVNRYGVAWTKYTHDNALYWTQMFMYDEEGKSIDLSPLDVGQHAVISLKVTNDDGSDLDASIANNMIMTWYISDLDVPDKTTGNDPSYADDMIYRESVQFNTGFDSNMYVFTDTILGIDEAHAKFCSTEPTGSEGQKELKYSTVVALQNTPTATIEWWGSHCGTALRFRKISASPSDSSLSLIKEVIETPKNNFAAGFLIKYKFTITNNSDVALHNITLTDILDGVIIDEWLKSTLNSKESIVVYGHYVLTQNDIDNKKSIYNVAKVMGIDPNDNLLIATDDATVELIANPKTGINPIIIIGLLVISFASFILMFYKKKQGNNL